MYPRALLVSPMAREYVCVLETCVTEPVIRSEVIFEIESIGKRVRGRTICPTIALIHYRPMLPLDTRIPAYIFSSSLPLSFNRSLCRACKKESLINFIETVCTLVQPLLYRESLFIEKDSTFFKDYFYK